MTLTFDAFRIGTTFGNLALLPTYGLVGPRATTPSYSMPVELASGVVKNLGWLQCQWEWTYLDQAMYTILRARFPSQSGSVYITTFDDALAWINYLAIYRVQTPLPMAEAGRRIQVAVSFVNMVVVTS